MADQLSYHLDSNTVLFKEVGDGVPERMEGLLSRFCLNTTSLFKVGEPSAQVVAVPVVNPFQRGEYPAIFRQALDVLDES